MFARLVFLDGDTGRALVDMAHEGWSTYRRSVALVSALAEAWDVGEYHDIHEVMAGGTSDYVVVAGPYVLSMNYGLGYVGLERAVTQDGEPGDDGDWCIVCGHWADHCLGGHVTDDWDAYEEAQEAIDGYLALIRGEE